MDFGIKGKRALVFGGSSGLGLAICDALAAEGVNLVIFARNSERLAAAKLQLTQRHAVTVETFAGNMTSAEEVQTLASHLRASGGLDILVLNSGRPPSPMRELLEEDEPARWEEAYRQQLDAVLIGILSIVPLLVDRGWGRVIGITSATVKQPMPKHAISSVFRAGVQAALKHLSNEVAARGVTVNTVAPAGILTEGLAKFHDLSKRAEAIPTQRLGTQEEFAATVAFLASRQAGFINGQAIQVDGGMTQSLV
ncbi:MAG: SDR family oxidoreductase [Pseudomonadota bacterium]